MRNEIIQAINDRHRLVLRYKGAERVVEPHACGINRPGNEVLSCFQVSGGSGSASSNPWKLLLLNEITDLTISPETFPEPREAYVRNSELLIQVFAQL